MNDLKENKREVSFDSLFAFPLMAVQLDLDCEKLAEFAYQLLEKDKIGVQQSNKGGWQSIDIHHEKKERYVLNQGGYQSRDIHNEVDEEFVRLKKEINQYLQIYHSEVFKGMAFNKENVKQNLVNMWVNINEQNHYNDLHAHPFSTLSGTFYINHDCSKEQGDIIFKHPKNLYIGVDHWPEGLVETPNLVTSGAVNIVPKSNMLLIFPSWLEHKVEINLKNDSRISVSFNSIPSLEKKS